MNGTNHPSNIELLTIQEHAAWHYELWVYYGCWQDLLAWKGLSGQVNMTTIKHERMVGDRNVAKRPEVQQKLKSHANEIANRNKKIKSKYYQIITNTAETFIIFGLKTFCKENNLDQAAMWRVSRGKQISHKSWKCRELTDSEISNYELIGFVQNNH